MMIQDKVKILLSDTIQNLGCECWGVEVSQQSRQAFLRIYIDKPEGVTVEDCERVSRQVNALLDVHELFSGPYRLEISSPGIPRPLFYPEQYTRYVGHVVQLKLAQLDVGRRKVQGVIVSADPIQVILSVDEVTQSFLFSNITKAILVV